MPGRRSSTDQRKGEDNVASRRVGSRGKTQVARGGAGRVNPENLTLPMLRTSERSTLKTCEWRWDLEFNQLRKPLVAMPALRFGTLIHKALASYYILGTKRGIHPGIGFEQAYQDELKINSEKFGAKVKDIEGDEKWVNALELGLAMMSNYVDEYGDDDQWEVLATEVPFETVVYHRACSCKTSAFCTCGHRGKAGKPWFLYVGVMDGIWRRRKDKTLWIPDHKSTAGIGDSKLNYLVMDDQAGSYWSFGVQWMVQQEILKKNQNLNGMLYNFLRKALPDVRPSRLVNGKRMYLNQPTKKSPLGEVSKQQPSPYFLRQPIHRGEYDRARVMLRAEVDYDRIERFRSGQLPTTKNPGMFTCPSCWARDACELHETGSDWVNFVKETTREWDPYEEHEIYGGR